MQTVTNILDKARYIGDELLDKTVIGSYTWPGYYLRKLWWDDHISDATALQGKICIVTGANAGLGKIVSKQLASLGATVYLLCRNLKRGEAARREIIDDTANENVHLEIVDLSSQSSIKEFATRFQQKNQRLDVLINNAGVLLDERMLSADGVEMTFATNVLGYFSLTNLLMPLLKNAAPSRVINVSSGGMYLARLNPDDLQFEKRPFDGVQAYAESKRAEVILTEYWAKQLSDAGVFVHAMHPGWADTPGVQTSLPNFRKLMQPFLRTPEQGADTATWLAVTPDIANYPNGQFWFDRQIRPVHKIISPRNTPDEIEQFLKICEELGQTEN